MHTRIVNSFKLKPYDWLGTTAAKGLRQSMRGILKRDRYWATMLHPRKVPRSCQQHVGLMPTGVRRGGAAIYCWKHNLMYRLIASSLPTSEAEARGRKKKRGEREKTALVSSDYL